MRGDSDGRVFRAFLVVSHPRTDFLPAFVSCVGLISKLTGVARTRKLSENRPSWTFWKVNGFRGRQTFKRASAHTPLSTCIDISFPPTPDNNTPSKFHTCRAWPFAHLIPLIYFMCFFGR